MAFLTMNHQKYEVDPGTRLSDAIGLHHSMEFPCGGKGRCGKCRVTAFGALSPVSAAEKNYLSSQELASGIRLACCAVVEGDCQVTLREETKSVVCTDGTMPDFAPKPLFQAFGAAVDIGTTTLAARLYGEKGSLAQAAMANPQACYGADVISRIGAALAGKSGEIARCIRGALKALLEELSGKADISPDQIDAVVITGNTAMLYLLTETNPDCLSHAPFEASQLFGEFQKGFHLDLPCPEAKVYLPRCVSAFVGADLVTALLASGIWRQEEISVLVDIGTNGEMALCYGKQLVCCSTAAGPAFEGTGLSMGMAGKEGAIDHVAVCGGKMRSHVIGNRKASGICGSGIVDALAAFLELGLMDETGYLEEDPVFLSEQVSVSRKDIRMVQLAKSAVCAGIWTLIESAGVSAAEIRQLVIAGGFGSYLNIENAGKIGLVPPELAKRARVIGNGALLGAAMILLNRDFAELSSELAQKAVTVDLTASPVFHERYMEEMMF